MAKLSDEEIDRETDRQFEAWFAKYGDAPEQPYAERVEIDDRSRLLILCMSDGRRVELPLNDIQGLAFASPMQLREFEMLGRGTGMDWPSLGVSFSVQGLLEGSYGNRLWMEALRRRGGGSPTERKPAVLRANGAKVSRPRKAKPSAA